MTANTTTFRAPQRYSVINIDDGIEVIYESVRSIRETESLFTLTMTDGETATFHRNEWSRLNIGH